MSKLRKSARSPAEALQAGIAPAQVWRLANGLGVLHRPLDGTRLVHCALVLDVGSRDEGPTERGMAHFVEHMVFKGTTRRKAFHILSCLDSVGGELNAFTTKEKTVYHATVTAQHLERAAELLFEIAFDASIPAAEIEKEKSVIADEIELYRDDPEEAIFEDFDQQVFGRHALGHPIAGTGPSIEAFDRSGLLRFYERHYTARRSVFSVVGHCTPEAVTQIAERHGAGRPAGTLPSRRRPPAGRPARTAQHDRAQQQTHFIVGGEAYALSHPRHAAFQLLINALGGPAMNSRLNLNIRERYGLGYNLQAFYQPFVDSGIWGVYAAVEPSRVERTRELVLRELEVLAERPLSAAAFARIVRQYVGQLTVAHENPHNLLVNPAKDWLDFGRVLDLEALIAPLLRLTPEDLQAVAAERFDLQALHRLTFAASE